MNDAVEAAKCFFIGKDFRPQNLAIDFALGDDFVAEHTNKFLLDRLILQNPPTQFVTGNDTSTPLFEKMRDGGLAGGDAAGQADDGDLGYAFASSQFGPTPISTFKGTFN